MVRRTMAKHYTLSTATTITFDKSQCTLLIIKHGTHQSRMASLSLFTRIVAVQLPAKWQCCTSAHQVSTPTHKRFAGKSASLVAASGWRQHAKIAQLGRRCLGGSHSFCDSRNCNPAGGARFKKLLVISCCCLALWSLPQQNMWYSKHSSLGRPNVFCWLACAVPGVRSIAIKWRSSTALF